MKLKAAGGVALGLAIALVFVGACKKDDDESLPEPIPVEEPPPAEVPEESAEPTELETDYDAGTTDPSSDPGPSSSGKKSEKKKDAGKKKKEDAGGGGGQKGPFGIPIPTGIPTVIPSTLPFPQQSK